MRPGWSGCTIREYHPSSENWAKGEIFWRGVCIEKDDDKAGATTTVDVMRSLVRPGFEKQLEDICAKGRPVYEAHGRLASDHVAYHSRVVNCPSGLKALLVSCSIPVLPVARAAARHPGVDLGINMRYGVKDLSTQLTFVASRPGVDLSWVHDPKTFNGGGYPELKGCKISGRQLLLPDQDIMELFPLRTAN